VIPTYTTVVAAVTPSGRDEWHIECRFPNGEKHAPVVIDGEHEDLADLICRLLNDHADDMPCLVWRDVYGRAAYTYDDEGRAIPVLQGDRALVGGWLVATWDDELACWDYEAPCPVGLLVEEMTPEGGKVLLDLRGAGFLVGDEPIP
jgi:hypothetical protein